MSAKPIRALWVLLLALLLAPAACPAADWPQWLGPRGNNIADDDGFAPDLTQWKVLWKANVGLGYSSLSVAAGKAYAMGNDNSNETVYCFDAASGNVVWKFPYPGQWIPAANGKPGASVSVVGDKVVTLGQSGQIFCLSAGDGSVIWQANLFSLLGAAPPNGRLISSPFIQNGQVILNSGRVASLDIVTGKILWQSSPTNPPSYSSPVVFTRAGKDYVATLDTTGITILKAQGGDAILRIPLSPTFAFTMESPTIVQNGNQIFISGNTNGQMLAFSGDNFSVTWDSGKARGLLNDCVVPGDMILGIDSEGRFDCLSATDGSTIWKRPGFGPGSVIGVGKNLLALTRGGALVTIDPAPAGYSEVSRLQVIGPGCWNAPIYAGTEIFVRNDHGDIVCLGR